jgi:hypothetical protein
MAPRRGCAGDEAVVSEQARGEACDRHHTAHVKPVEQLRREQLRTRDAAAVAPVELQRLP